MPTTAESARAQLKGKTIWLWHYMHSDWQWEQSRAWHADRYALAVHEALDLMQRDAEFVYFIDNESEYFEPVARQLGPRLEELKQRVREGRVRFASTQVANCRPTQTADETYLRNLQLGREFLTANLPPTDLSLFHSVDIAIGGVQMPQVLKLAGFKYYRAWRPHGPMNAHRIPHQFIWEAPDGSRILVTRGAYGGLYLPNPAFDTYQQDWDAAVVALFDEFFADQLLVNRSPSDQLWMIQGCDDVRPLRRHNDAPVDLLGFIDEWRKREATPIRWCTPLEYSQTVAEHTDGLAVLKGALDGCDCGYNAAFGGANGLWRWRQMNDRRLIRAEWWNAAATLAVGAPEQREEVHKLWRQHLTYQAHAQEACFADDLAELFDVARDVKFHAEKIERAALKTLIQAAGGGTRTTRYLFNPHPWPLQAEVEIFHPCAVAGVGSLTVADEQGVIQPSQVLREFRHGRFGGSLTDQTLLVRAKLPPFGYKRIDVNEHGEPSPTRLADPGEEVNAAGMRLTFSNHALRMVRDANGVLYRSRSGNVWPYLAFHVLDNQDWLSMGPELHRELYEPASSAWLQSGPLRFQHRSQGMLGPWQAQVDTIIGAHEREIALHIRLEGHWQEAAETGFVTMLADIAAVGQITVDTPYAVEPRDPDHEYYIDNLPPDAAELGDLGMFERLRPGYFWGRSWADWSGEGRGMTWLSVDGPYYWMKEPGAVGPVLVRALARYAATWEQYAADASTGAGVHEFDYVLRFHNGDWRKGDPQRRSQELRHPPVVARPNYPTQPLLADSHSFMELSANALLSAYYVESDAAVIRIYDREGQGGEVSITLDWAPTGAQVVDLIGNVLDTPVQLDGQRVVVTLRPWQIATLRLKR
jgi:hypothetical protein